MASTQKSSSLLPGVAFVTGGGRGLGLAIAVSFAKSGARGVVIVDIQDDETMKGAKAEVESHGNKVKCLPIRANVADEKDFQSAIAKAVSEFGRIDYAANFAGVGGPHKPISETTVEEWEKVMAVNATGVFISTKHELLQMMKQDSIEVEAGRVPQKGSIVNCASVNSVQSMAGTGIYTASKHAVAGITKAAALEARQHGIRVNSLSPGFILTKIAEPIVKSDPQVFEVWKTFEARQGRQGKPEEIGDAVALLSSAQMSLVNGHNLIVDGGFTVNTTTY